jgi:GNAT superfamily N-acetyltransferase
MAIRLAVPADLTVVVQLVREFYTIDRHPFDEARVRPAVERLLADDSHGQVWLIARAGSSDVDGYGVITWGYSIESGGRDALLDELYVRHRGAGIGSTALGEILDAAAQAGASRVFLETEAHNSRVRSFYARHGFQAEDSVWMSKDLET